MERVFCFVILDGVTDVHNIGAIVRDAVCCCAQAIVIPDKGLRALNEDAVKTSAGAWGTTHLSSDYSAASIGYAAF